MKLKTCVDCKEEKSINEFSISKNKHREKCKICLKLYMKKHYENNKKTYIDYANKKNKEIKEWFYEFKSTLKCERCDENHTACLDFHHKDPNEKDGNVTSLLVYNNKKRILKEIDKCIVLCSNCHRKLHYEEKYIAIW